MLINWWLKDYILLNCCFFIEIYHANLQFLISTEKEFTYSGSMVDWDLPFHVFKNPSDTFLNNLLILYASKNFKFVYEGCKVEGWCFRKDGTPIIIDFHVFVGLTTNFHSLKVKILLVSYIHLLPEHFHISLSCTNSGLLYHIWYNLVLPEHIPITIWRLFIP